MELFSLWELHHDYRGTGEDERIEPSKLSKARHAYPLAALCRVLAVSASGYADWLASGGPSHWLSDAQLLTLVRSTFAEFDGAYGAPRIYRELKATQHPVSKERAQRLMKQAGLKARHKRRYKVTTDSKHNLPVARNLLNRQFDVQKPDQVWTADITYIPTQEGWLYLAVVMDLYTRAIIGWSMDSRIPR